MTEEELAEPTALIRYDGLMAPFPIEVPLTHLFIEPGGSRLLVDDRWPTAEVIDYRMRPRAGREGHELTGAAKAHRQRREEEQRQCSEAFHKSRWASGDA